MQLTKYRRTMKAAVFLVALVVASVRASPLEGRPLRDDAKEYSTDHAADNDNATSTSGDEEDWPDEFLETGEPSEFYLQEVREQLEKRIVPQEQPLTRSRRHGIPEIYHGKTIGLQYVYASLNWLSCWDHICDKRPCPGLYITGADQNTCQGEEFRIFRLSGPGAVQSGDLIGLYYPYRGSWLGCAGSDCRRGSCPGYPTTAYGFQDTERWYRCYSEVFKIYARGKGLGKVIQEHDHVSLFHNQQRTWLSMWDYRVTLKTCPGQVRPRPTKNYDHCWGETFEIWGR